MKKRSQKLFRAETSGMMKVIHVVSGGAMALFSPSPNADSTVQFVDRREAGIHLAQAVLREIEANPAPDPVSYRVYALPKGGLPVAQPVACSLQCPLDVIVAKKITSLDNQELAIGAVTADGQVLWANQRRYRNLSIETVTAPLSPWQTQALHQAQNQAGAQQVEFAAYTPPGTAEGTIALLVDDGVATGMTMAVAVQSLRSQQPAQIWVCAPVAPLEMMPFLDNLADRVIVLATPHPFNSVSRFYREFHQVTMEEAIECLQVRN